LGFVSEFLFQLLGNLPYPRFFNDLNGGLTGIREDESRGIEEVVGVLEDDLLYFVEVLWAFAIGNPIES
jgi:hypothetical protein